MNNFLRQIGHKLLLLSLVYSAVFVVGCAKPNINPDVEDIKVATQTKLYSGKISFKTPKEAGVFNFNVENKHDDHLTLVLFDNHSGNKLITVDSDYDTVKVTSSSKIHKYKSFEEFTKLNFGLEIPLSLILNMLEGKTPSGWNKGWDMSSKVTQNGNKVFIAKKYQVVIKIITY